MQRAKRMEILGSWLRVWTPPRDVHVPPPPLKKIALIAAAFVLVSAGAAALIVPAVDGSKDRRARSEAIRDAANQRAEFKRLVRDQRAVLGRIDPPPAPGTRASEVRMTAVIAAHVKREATTRLANGELEGRLVPGPARCRKRDGSTFERLRLECVAVTTTVTVQGERVGSIGYPFIVHAFPATGRYAFCKDNPEPGEKAATIGNQPALPKACRR